MNTVVYYPHTCPTPDWLRLASLCWDKIYTVTPDGNYLGSQESYIVNKALGGILEHINITDISGRIDVQEQFIKWVEEYKSRLCENTEQYTVNSYQIIETLNENNISLLNENIQFPKKKNPRFQKGRKGDAKRYVPVRADKLNAEIRIKDEPEYTTQTFLDFLSKNGLAKSEYLPQKTFVPVWLKEHYENGGGFSANDYPPSTRPGTVEAEIEEKYWNYQSEIERELVKGNKHKVKELSERLKSECMVAVESPYNKEVAYIPKDIAQYFFTLCASKTAMTGRRDLAGDTERFNDVIYHDFQLRGHVATSVLEAFIPKDFYSMPPDRFAEIREELKLQRLKYQKDVDSICGEFSKISSEGELDQVKNKIVDIAKERVEATKNIHRKSKCETIIKILSVSLTPPALVSSISSFLGIGLFIPAGIAASLALFTAQLLIENREKESASKNAPWSYALDVIRHI